MIHAVNKLEQGKKVLCSTVQGKAEGAIQAQHAIPELHQLKTELSCAQYRNDAAQVG